MRDGGSSVLAPCARAISALFSKRAAAEMLITSQARGIKRECTYRDRTIGSYSTFLAIYTREAAVCAENTRKRPNVTAGTRASFVENERERRKAD